MASVIGPPLQGVTFLTLMTALVLASPAYGGAPSVLWAITGLGECRTERCGQVVNRSLEFSCYAASSRALAELPQTSPRMFAAKSSDGRLNESRCIGIPPPKIRSVECPVVECKSSEGAAAPAAAANAATSTSGGGHSWRWSFESGVRCSARCNHPGTLSVPTNCIDSKGSPAKAEACDQHQRPELALPCYTFDGCGPEWRAGPWGQCDRKCGLGEIERKIECYQLVDSSSGPTFQKRKGQCSHSEEKPHSKEYCVLNKTCPPFYRTSPEKCRLHLSGTNDLRLCNETGLVRNRPQCVQLTADLRTRANLTVRVSPDLCIALNLKRPDLFSKCRVDKETLVQRKVKCIDPDVARVPQFTLVSNMLVQMERRESLQVNCGQSATVIPGTHLRLHCKVANFKAHSLKWRRPGSSELVPSGTACKRLCVVDGDLVIPRFKPKDSGVYEVIAGSKTATLSLHSHTAYEAYIQAYLPRMMLLLPNSKVRQQIKFVQLDTPTRDTLLWMTGPWTACSVPCGGSGHRNRTVYCEQLQSSLYTIVDDSVCRTQIGERPPDSETCGSHTCPVWQVGEWDTTCSERHCYSMGYSLLTRQVRCVNQANQPLLDAQCGHEKKPETVHKCRNQNCQPKWLSNPWSQCSVSCGAYGFSSRQIQCVWQPTGQPAGFACETANLEPPKSFKACYNGPCEMLGCVDLSKVCTIYQASALCAHASLRRNCCKTCNEYQLHVYNSLSTRVVSKTTV